MRQNFITLTGASRIWLMLHIIWLMLHCYDRCFTTLTVASLLWLMLHYFDRCFTTLTDASQNMTDASLLWKVLQYFDVCFTKLTDVVRCTLPYHLFFLDKATMYTCTSIRIVVNCVELVGSYYHLRRMLTYQLAVPHFSLTRAVAAPSYLSKLHLHHSITIGHIVNLLSRI